MPDSRAVNHITYPERALGWLICNYGTISNSQRIVEILLESGANVDHLGSNSKGTLLDCAASRDDLVLIDYLLGKGAVVDCPPKYDSKAGWLMPMMIAIMSGHVLSSRKLLLAGANVNYRSAPELPTMLHITFQLQNFDTTLPTAASSRDTIKVVKSERGLNYLHPYPRQY